MEEKAEADAMKLTNFCHPSSNYYKQTTMKLAIASILAGSAAAFAPTAQHQSFSSFTTTALNARKPFISGNWKLNPQTKDEALTLAKDIAASITDGSPDADVALFVPYVFIESAMGAVSDKLSVGAEVRIYREINDVLCMSCAQLFIC